MAKPLLSSSVSRLAFAAWWLLWLFLQWSVLSTMGYSTKLVVTDSAVSAVILCGSCLLVMNNMRYYLPSREKYWYIFTVSAVLSLLSVAVIRGILYLLFKDDVAYTAFLRASTTIRFGFSFLVTGCVSAISLLWFTQQEKARDEIRKKETEQLAKDAELFHLRQQLQPHFLFNSLNSVSALIGSQPEKARHMIQQLSDFLRGTLKKEENKWNSLSEEMEHLQLYLDIEKVRFGHRLQTDIKINEAAAAFQLPALLLQPVVENAIKFGLYDTTGDVCIAINVQLQEEQLHIIVENPYDAATAQPVKGTGFGLASIKRRLFLLFGRHDLLQTTASNNKFITTITIPKKI